jgi:hypothetical protein
MNGLSIAEARTDHGQALSWPRLSVNRELYVPVRRECRHRENHDSGDGGKEEDEPPTSTGE